MLRGDGLASTVRKSGGIVVLVAVTRVVLDVEVEVTVVDAVVEVLLKGGAVVVGARIDIDVVVVVTVTVVTVEVEPHGQLSSCGSEVDLRRQISESVGEIGRLPPGAQIHSFSHPGAGRLTAARKIVRQSVGDGPSPTEVG